MDKIRQLSNSVHNRVCTTKDGKIPVFVDPATIMMIMTLVQGLIKAIMECRKARQEQLKVVQTPTAFQRFTLKRRLKKTLGKQKYKEEGDYYYNALLDEGKFLTEKDLDEIENDIK